MNAAEVLLVVATLQQEIAEAVRKALPRLDEETVIAILRSSADVIEQHGD